MQRGSSRRVQSVERAIGAGWKVAVVSFLDTDKNNAVHAEAYVIRWCTCRRAVS